MLSPTSKFSSEVSSGSNRSEMVVEDDTLWAQLKSGNELAFSSLYNRYVNKLFNYGMHTCKDRDLIKECLQEMFVRLWDRRETLGVAGSVNFYLFKSFRRLLIKRLVAKRFLLMPFQENPDSLFEFIPSTEDTIIMDEAKAIQLARLKSCLHTLTKRQREAIYLKFFNELSYHEVASVMEVRVDSVYNLISKGIDILRTKLRDPSF